MILWEQLTKTELLKLTRQQHIKASTRLKKKELIMLLNSSRPPNNIFQFTQSQKNSKNHPLIITPDRTIQIQEKREIIILPQSHLQIFLIWRASPEYDKHTQAWLIKTDTGYTEKVSPSSRSVFLDKKHAKNNIKLFRIKQDGGLEFFSEVQGKIPKYNTPSQKDILTHLKKHNSSGLYFK